MMKKYLIFILSLCLSSAIFAASFVEGKDYEVINSDKPKRDHHKLEIVEFFSYGCPWCYRFDPVITQWEKKLPRDVEFKRVHVTFESGWNNLAKAFYTARALDLVPKINEDFFNLAQKERSNFDEGTLTKVFTKYGVDEKKFISTFRFSTGLNTQIMRGETLMRDYKVMSVPAIVVAGKYKTDSGMARGDALRFIETVKYLTNKARKESK